MSQENVESFSRAVEANNRWEVEAVLRELDPEIEFHAVLEELLGGEGRVYWGHDGYRQFFRDFDEAFAEVYWEYPDIRDLGERLLAIGYFRARGRRSGAQTEVPLGLVVDYKDGVATRVWSTLDPCGSRRQPGSPPSGISRPRRS
jgi:hypothetical protein